MASRKLITTAGVCALGLYIGYLLIARVHTNHVLKSEAAYAAIPDVAVITPKPAPQTVSLTLPGTLSAWYNARIYPQVSGYVKMWYEDYGAEVKAGDLLAEINAPSLDAQYGQAKADLAAAQAKYNLAVVTANRWQAMGKSQSVSGQAVSVSLANMRSKQATLEAAQHNVDRFAALEKFKRLVAPFDGVVVARNVSVGDYVHNGAGDMDATGSSRELFTVANVTKLRLFVSVPEVFSFILQPNLIAEFSTPQYPERIFKAKFLTVSRGYDPNTRTAVTEFVMDNSDRALWPGTFASVKLTAKNVGANLLRIPSGALVFMEKGMQVAVVEDDSRVHFKSITVGRMADSYTEVKAGIAPTDRVINSPPSDLLEGEKVRVVTPEKGYYASSSAQVTKE